MAGILSGSVLGGIGDAIAKGFNTRADIEQKITNEEMKKLQSETMRQHLGQSAEEHPLKMEGLRQSVLKTLADISHLDVNADLKKLLLNKQIEAAIAKAMADKAKATGQGFVKDGKGGIHRVNPDGTVTPVVPRPQTQADVNAQRSATFAKEFAARVGKMPLEQAFKEAMGLAGMAPTAGLFPKTESPSLTAARQAHAESERIKAEAYKRGMDAKINAAVAKADPRMKAAIDSLKSEQSSLKSQLTSVTNRLSVMGAATPAERKKLQKERDEILKKLSANELSFKAITGSLMKNLKIEAPPRSEKFESPKAEADAFLNTFLNEGSSPKKAVDEEEDEE